LSKFQRSDLDFARDELMSHVHRCGVLQAEPDQQQAWMDDTIGYMAERFPGMGPEDLNELREIGMRFCQPVIPHGKGNTALTLDENDAVEAQGAEDEAEAEADAEEQEMAGAV
jgi:hypothetical protein